MLEHILIAIDGSGPSRHAARFGLSLASQIGARVTLLTVIQPPEVIPAGAAPGNVVMSPRLASVDTGAVTKMLDTIGAEFPAVPCVKQIEVGSVADTICDVAAHQAVDMVVLGSRGLGLGRRFLLGSVSDRVVHHARCPVTVWR